jgi:RNA polymerase subunit RPABC4/transcription elongation factor Spt4
VGVLVTDGARTEPAPAALFRVRLVIGNNLLHLVCRNEPTGPIVIDGAGNVDLSSWDPIEGSQSDHILYLKAESLTGVAYRRADTPREIARAKGDAVLPIDNAPEQRPGVVLRACAECGTSWARTRRICPNCGNPRFRARAGSTPRAAKEQPVVPTRGLRNCPVCGMTCSVDKRICDGCGFDGLREPKTKDKT